MPIAAQHIATNRTHQLLWCLLCVALLDALHDTWFYWTHRLLHCKPLYKHVHYMHHRCELVMNAMVMLRAKYVAS